MNKEILEKIVLRAIKTSASIEFGSLVAGERLYEVNRQEASIISSLMGDMIKQINTNVFKIGEVERTSEDMENPLLRAYIYTFDKTLEIAYCIRTGIDNGFEWDSDDMLNGISGDKIPEYLQLKIMPMIPYVGMIYRDVFEFSKPLVETSDMRTVYDAILYSAVQLGTEVGLRLDYENSSEWDKYMDE